MTIYALGLYVPRIGALHTMRISRARTSQRVIFCPVNSFQRRSGLGPKWHDASNTHCHCCAWARAIFPSREDFQATTSAGQKLVCAERTVCSPVGEESLQHLTVPLNFGLEMAASFPKSYRWLSEETKSTPPSSATTRSSPARTTDASRPTHPLEHVTVYSLRDDVSVVQISDEHRHQPIEYSTCFTSRRHLEQAWRVGRSYLLAATLANRASLRQRVINAVHRKFARVAMHGVEFPFGEGPPDAGRERERGRGRADGAARGPAARGRARHARRAGEHGRGRRRSASPGHRSVWCDHDVRCNQPGRPDRPGHQLDHGWSVRRDPRRRQTGAGR